MTEFGNKAEREYIVSQLMTLGLNAAAKMFEKNGICAVFNTRTGKTKPLSGLDVKHAKHVEELFDSRTYLIIRAYDSRKNIGRVDFFLGLDDDGFTEFISAKPESGAISAPVFYANKGYRYGIESFGIESFMYSQISGTKSWECITSLHPPYKNKNPDIDDDDLPF